MDSVMGLELRNRLVAALGLVIPATVLWTYPTIQALAAHLADALVPSERATLPNAVIPVKPVTNGCVQTPEPESVDEAAAAFALLDDEEKARLLAERIAALERLLEDDACVCNARHMVKEAR
jgi:epothilone polyketide synthase E